MNSNLLQITTVPVQIEINVTRASLESPGKQLPRMNVRTSKKGGFKMEATPAKLKIDTYEARSSVGLGGMNTADLIRDEAQRGIKLAYQGTARIVEDGNAVARGSSSVDIAVKNERAGQTIQTIMEFIPKTGANISFDDGALNIRYEMDNVDINWEHLEASRLVFNPGRVEINVAQHPQIVIEYVGEPIYVPPSANPDYEPVLNVLG
ncbi:MAG: DUF6470 family protein [Oscillospiraceae bacterium]|nr:DUF6470 family protein [Oscillospiraceae bacterium]